MDGDKSQTARSVLKQLALDFPPEAPRYESEDFLVSASNRPALAIVDAFLESETPALAIVGPAGSGKTHLLHLLAARAGVRIRLGSAFGAAPAELLIAIDQVESARPPDLLILIEKAKETRVKIALAGSGEPRSWARGLVDLETRLSAMARASLEEPDEALMRAVMKKAFADRGLRVPSSVVDYAAPRLSRTFAAARRFVNQAEARLKEGGSDINLALARKVLSDLSEDAAAP